MRKNIHITIIFSLLLALPLWTGCNNEMEGDSSNSSNGGVYSGEPIRIEASVGNIGNFGGTTTRSTGNRKNIFVQPLDENQDTGFDFVTTVEDIPAIETRANVAMPNVKFRMIAYKNGGVKVTNFAGLGDYQTDPSEQQQLLPVKNCIFRKGLIHLFAIVMETMMISLHLIQRISQSPYSTIRIS